MGTTGIRYLDGRRLRRAMIAGARFVTDRAEPLNRINVYPVPDGDTGTNLAMTLARIAHRAAFGTETGARAAAVAMADEAVSGARGNSGAILAQFLTGFSEAIPEKRRIDTAEFGQAVLRGSESARTAIQRPQEGTILTVLRDWAQDVAAQAHLRDFVALLSGSLRAASTSLARTPEKLALLKKSGVVDAGGQGFVYLLEGIVRYIRDAARGAIPEPPPDVAAATFDRSPESILFRFCTEALLEGVSLDRDALRQRMALLGDSLVIAGSASKMRVHIHTNEPELVFSQLGELATVEQTKVEDMRHQHERRFDESRKGRVAIVTDSACDLPDSVLEELAIQMVPMRVHFGRENYLDRVTIRAAEFYARFAVCDEFPKTSQPPPADFRQVYESLAVHHASIVSIHLSGALSGTLQAAISVSRTIPDTRVLTVDSKGASIAEGLVVRAAAEAVQRGATAEEAAEIARRAAERVRLFVAVPTIEHLVRGGRVSAGKGMIARWLKIFPVLTIGPDGKAREAAKAFGHAGAVRKMMARLFDAAGTGSGQRFGVVHADALESAEILAREIRSRYPSSDVLILECAPVLGAHGGPGALGVAVLPEG
ncbi:MAG: DegV family protein [Thermoanaerobaculia bacterium]